jgi:hypothetical protein
MIASLLFTPASVRPPNPQRTSGVLSCVAFCVLVIVAATIGVVSVTSRGVNCLVIRSWKEGGLTGGRLSRPGGSNCQPVEGVSPFHVESAAEEGRWARGRFRQCQVAIILLVGARARENGRTWRATPKLLQMSPAWTQTILRVVSIVTLLCLPLCPFSIWRHMVSLGSRWFRG